VAALVVATPSGDDDPAVTTPNSMERPLRVSLLERPQGDQDRVIDLTGEPFRLAPASLRLAVARGGSSWYAARPAGRPDAVCLVRFGSRAGGCSGDGVIARQGAYIRRWSPAEGVTEFVGLVPDGIESVQIGATSAPVHDNVFTLLVDGVPERFAILSGPSALAIPPAASVVASAPSGSAPVVAVALRPDVGAAVAPVPPMTLGTLDQAAAAVPFTVLAADPPPANGGLRVGWSAPAPGVVPQVIVDYMPVRFGRAITLIEAPPRGRSPRGGERVEVRGGREIYVVDGTPPPLRSVRTIAEGTEVRISGDDASLEELIGVAASLRPVAP
jgi:hypothetical protein